ncbi:MAG: basic amino acid ABC transporter substrate-binding protein [Defluviitaleaceae bacterium]|nr:basic amino acid ABC transporter substrate-binding protein [Defluviitaleaceae bacterium]
MKKIFAVLALVLIAAVAAACGNGNDDSGWDTIVMGTSADFPPFEFIADDGQGRHGQYDGIDVAIAVRIAEHLGAELVIHDADFGGLIMDLNAGRIDFIAAAMTITEERAEQVSFSDSYFTALQYMAVPIDDDRIQSTADLEGMMVGVQIGTTGDMFVSYEVDGVEPQRYNRANEAFMALRAGQLDAIVIDSPVASMFVDAYPDELRIVRDNAAFGGENYGIAVRQEDTELLAAINEVIAQMRAAGEIDELFAYFTQR